jgi:hypothetical protein
MIDCDKMYVESLVNRLSKVEGIQYIRRIVSGPYAIILKVEGKDNKDLKERVENFINLGHVNLTVSLIVLQSYSKISNLLTNETERINFHSN